MRVGVTCRCWSQLRVASLRALPFHSFLFPSTSSLPRQGIRKGTHQDEQTSAHRCLLQSSQARLPAARACKRARGSDWLIDLIASGRSLDSLADAITKDNVKPVPDLRPHQGVIVEMVQLVDQVALGDAVLRSRQELPPFPSAHGDPLSALTRSSECQIDYVRLWEYIERESVEAVARWSTVRNGKRRLGVLGLDRF